ncbi:MAG: Wzz/FepE/Etk N-terminal domain-containing protein, partial [Achromobacter sp.]
MNSSINPSPNSPAASPAEDDIDLGHYLDILLANKWLIAAITALVLAIGVAYAAMARPVYEANILIQIEDIAEGGGGKGALADAGALFDVKTPASGEMEIIRSRMIVGQAVEATKLYISAAPRYVPYIGGWLARRSSGLSEPGFLGFEGYVSGTERIIAPTFNVPTSLEGSGFLVTAKSGGQYTLSSPAMTAPVTGTVGTLLKAESGSGPIELLISELAGKPGAQYTLSRSSKQSTITALQAALILSEKGKASSIISVAMQDGDPYRLVRVLNAVGAQYVRQNIERKAAEAQKTLAFLDVQLPEFKRQLESAESSYNRYRNEKGTVSLNDETQLILTQSVDRQTKLLDAQQRRRELESRFTANHPLVQTLDAQIAALNRDAGDVQAKIKALPAVQQEAVRLERDVKVNTELYQS